MSNTFYVIKEKGGYLYLIRDSATGFFSWTDNLDAAQKFSTISGLLNWFRYTPLNKGKDTVEYQFDIVRIEETVLNTESVVE